MNATPTLKSFYTALREWIDAGTPTDNLYMFDADNGLCANLLCYLKGEGYGPSTSEYYALDLEQWDSFTMAGLNGTFPFNSGPDSTVGYAQEKNKYTNPKRLAWIKTQLQTL